MKLLLSLKNSITNKPWRSLGIFVLICFLLYIVLGWSKSATVSAYAVSKQDYVPSLLLSGEVIPESQAILSSPIGGTVQQVLTNKGASVKKGQLIAQIDDRLARSAVERAEGEVKLAQLALNQSDTVALSNARQTSVQMNLSLEQAQKNYTRSEALAQSGAISSRDLEQAFQDLRLAQERAQTAKINLQALENNGVNRAILQTQLKQRERDLEDKKLLLEQHKIIAPSDGVIINVLAREGELVQSSSKLAMVASSQKTRIRIQPDQRYAALAAINQSAQVWLPTDTTQKWPAKTVFNEPSGNASQGSLTVELSLNEYIPVLYPGRLVSVQLFGPQEKDVIIIPSTFLTEQKGSQGVWIATQDKASFLPLELGLQTPEGLIVKAGLKAGDIILNPTNLKEGQRVTPQIKG